MVSCKLAALKSERHGFETRSMLVHLEKTLNSLFENDRLTKGKEKVITAAVKKDTPVFKIDERTLRSYGGLNFITENPIKTTLNLAITETLQ